MISKYVFKSDLNISLLTTFNTDTIENIKNDRQIFKQSYLISNTINSIRTFFLKPFENSEKDFA